MADVEKLATSHDAALARYRKSQSAKNKAAYRSASERLATRRTKERKAVESDYETALVDYQDVASFHATQRAKKRKAG